MLWAVNFLPVTLSPVAHDQPLVVGQLAIREAVNQSPATEDLHLRHPHPVGAAGFEHSANFLGKCEVGDSGAAKSAALNRSFGEKAKPDRPDTASGNPGEPQPSEPGNRLAEALRIIASLSETERELLIRLLESFGKNKP
jgi:hypothetical protein